MTRAGSCQCGHVRYEVSGPDIGLVLCYCTECQRLPERCPDIREGGWAEESSRRVGGCAQTRMNDGSASARSAACVCCRRSYHEPRDRLARFEAQLGRNDLRLQSRIGEHAVRDSRARVGSARLG